MGMRAMKTTGKLLAALVFIVSAGLQPSRAAADLQWIDLSVEGGDSVRAAFGAVEGGRGPAVIFNHGTGVRHFGHQGSARIGDMDVTDYVKSLNALGYTAIAPVRSHLKDSAFYERGGTVGSTTDWIAVVENGMHVAKAARSFLAANDNVDPARIAIMGFSEGGNVTLWSAVRQQGYRAVVLLAPATLQSAKKYALKQAATQGNLSSFDAPVFLGVGQNDHASIRKVVRRRLVPNLEKTRKVVIHRLDYPGGHDWFYKPRDALLNDAGAFLADHLR